MFSAGRNVLVLLLIDLLVPSQQRNRPKICQKCLFTPLPEHQNESKPSPTLGITLLSLFLCIRSARYPLRVCCCLTLPLLSPYCWAYKA